MKQNLLPLLVLCAFSSCYPIKHVQKEVDPVVTVIPPTVVNEEGGKTTPFLEELLSRYPQYFEQVMKDRKARNLQIIYTQVDRGSNNLPKLTNYYFNVNPKAYFYPASTVKLPTVIMALERLNELKSKGIDRNITMITESAYSGQSAVYNDPTAPDGRPTIGHYVKKILMVSDNDAYNRLYEFLGQEYINENFRKKAYPNVQILHRLDIFLSEDENRHTNPVKFFDANNNLLYEQPMQFNKTVYPARNDSMGTAFWKSGQLVNSPMNFSKKNNISLEDLHNILRSLIFPASVPARQRFNLSPDDYRFLYKYMSQMPTESMFPAYGPPDYYETYCKFIMYGAEKTPVNKNIRIFNKPGDAYGQMLDIAYVLDFEKKIEFFLSAIINCDTDGILNDDKYDYRNIGFPTMKNLGKVIYEYELGRKREHVPDLSQFMMQYDK